MNKKLILVASVIVVAIVAGTAYLLMQGGGQGQPMATAPTEQTTPATEQGAAGKGTYTDYSESKLTTAQGTKLLFFHAPWCPQCVALEKDILDKGVPDGVTIFKVDFDTNQKLRQKYGVTLQTTLVKVDGAGNEIDQFVAYDDPTLESVKQNLLE